MGLGRQVDHGVGGHGPQAASLVPDHRERGDAEVLRPLLLAEALPHLSWRAAEARGPGGEGAREEHRRAVPPDHLGCARVPAGHAADAGGGASGAGAAQGDPEPAGVPPRRGPGLPDPGPQRRDALWRREPADPAGIPDGKRAHRSGVHPRRAEHRAASAGQRKAPGDAQAAAGPREFGDRRRARPGNHAGRGLDRRLRPWGGRARRAHRGPGNSGGGHGQPGEPDRCVPERARDDRGAASSASAGQGAPDRRGSQGEQPPERHGRVPAGAPGRGDRGERSGQVHPGERDPLSRPLNGCTRRGWCRGGTRGSREWNTSTR